MKKLIQKAIVKIYANVMIFVVKNKLFWYFIKKEYKEKGYPTVTQKEVVDQIVQAKKEILEEIENEYN